MTPEELLTEALNGTFLSQAISRRQLAEVTLAASPQLREALELGLAWQRVVATGWEITKIEREDRRHDSDVWVVYAVQDEPITRCECCKRATNSGRKYYNAEGPTPAAALTALAERLGGSR